MRPKPKKIITPSFAREKAAVIFAVPLALSAEWRYVFDR
jgi:hypothetical protein